MAVTNAVTTVNDCWPAVSLSTVLHARELKNVNNNATLELNRAYSKGTSYILFLFVLVSWSYDKYFSLIMSWKFTDLSKKKPYWMSQLSRPHPFKFFKGCLPQPLLVPFYCSTKMDLPNWWLVQLFYLKHFYHYSYNTWYNVWR